MNILFVKLASACLLAVSASSVLAASQAMSTISGFNFKLIDLDPHDGIAPSFTVDWRFGSSSMTVQANDDWRGAMDRDSIGVDGGFAFSEPWMIDLVSASASVWGSIDSLNAEGKAFGPATSYEALLSSVGDSRIGAITLSPKSRLVVEAQVMLSASATHPSPCSASRCHASESAYAHASLTLNRPESSEYDRASVLLLAEARGAGPRAFWEYDAEGRLHERIEVLPEQVESKTESRLISVSIMNEWSETKRVSLHVDAGVTGHGTTSPIPEPQAWALALVGLTLAHLLAPRGRARAKVIRPDAGAGSCRPASRRRVLR